MHGVATHGDVFLCRHAGFVAADCTALCDPNLGFYDVDTGDRFRHRVFHLNTRINLDEKKRAGIAVLQELDGAGIDVLRFAAQRQGGSAN